MNMNKFTQTGNIEDLDYEHLQKLVGNCASRPVPREDATEKEYYRTLNIYQLIIMAEYMRRNMTASNKTIVYEGAVRAFLIPGMIARLQAFHDSMAGITFKEKVMRELLESSA